MSKKLPKATIIKGKKPAANENYAEFNDERTLAELIQNAAARGLHSVRGGLFGRPMTKQELTDIETGDFESDGTEYLSTNYKGYEEADAVDPDCKRISRPPAGTTCACALGAQLMSPRLSDPLNYKAIHGNDATDGAPLETSVIGYADERSMQIGIAYEQALRP